MPILNSSEAHSGDLEIVFLKGRGVGVEWVRLFVGYDVKLVLRSERTALTKIR